MKSTIFLLFVSQSHGKRLPVVIFYLLYTTFSSLQRITTIPENRRTEIAAPALALVMRDNNLQINHCHERDERRCVLLQSSRTLFEVGEYASVSPVLSVIFLERILRHSPTIKSRHNCTPVVPRGKSPREQEWRRLALRL